MCVASRTCLQLTHIAYQTFGQHRFDDRCKKAWGTLWTRVSSCVTRSLNVGSNLIIVSLVQENFESLTEAMDCVPRGERDEVLTRIDVNGEIISPLNWAVQGGLLAIAQFVMSDLLTIRADRCVRVCGCGCVSTCSQRGQTGVSVCVCVMKCHPLKLPIHRSVANSNRLMSTSMRTCVRAEPVCVCVRARGWVLVKD